MSRAWMPIYWGDYLRDTRDLTTIQHGAYLLLIAHYWQHSQLPVDDTQLAAIAGLTPAKWRSISAPVAAKFQEGWRHKRIDQEIERSDRKMMQRAIAGQKGGQRSGVVRAISIGERVKQMASKYEANAIANGEAKTKPPRTIHKVSNITSSEFVAAREGLSEGGNGVASAELAAKIRGQG